MNTPQKPAHEIRLGMVKATIWRNENEHGVRFNTLLSRIYRDGDQWRNTESFGREDLLLVAKIADLAHSWIYAQSREAASGAQPSAGAAQPAAASPAGWRPQTHGSTALRGR